jgi:putative transposase
VYQEAEGKDVFVARAHAQDLETEQLSLAEAKAMSRRIRKQGRLVSNQSILSEVVSRDREVRRIQQEKQQGSKPRFEPGNPTVRQGMEASEQVSEPGLDKDRERSPQAYQSQVQEQASRELTAEQLLLHYASAPSSSPSALSSEQSSSASDDDEGVIPYDQIPDVEVYSIDELRGGRIGRW